MVSSFWITLIGFELPNYCGLFIIAPGKYLPVLNWRGQSVPICQKRIPQKSAIYFPIFSLPSRTRIFSLLITPTLVTRCWWYDPNVVSYWVQNSVNNDTASTGSLGDFHNMLRTTRKHQCIKVKWKFSVSLNCQLGILRRSIQGSWVILSVSH